MRTIGNILWLLLCGLWMSIAYVIAGILAMVLIVTIPFGLQAFKLAGYVLWPFGRSVVQREGRSGFFSLLGNIVWIILFGIELALVHLVFALIFFVSIIGIPFGVANVKFARIALAPFGLEVVEDSKAGGDTVLDVDGVRSD